MTKFVLQRLSPQNSVNTYFKIIKNGECYYDDFRDEIKKGGNLSADLAKIARFIENDEKGLDLPVGSFKLLKRNKNDNVVDFEFRTKKLRLYGFRDDSGNIIVIGGKNDKKQQVYDISRLRGIKKEYILWKNK